MAKKFRPYLVNIAATCGKVKGNTLKARDLPPTKTISELEEADTQFRAS